MSADTQQPDVEAIRAEPPKPDYELLAVDSAKRWLKHGRHEPGCDGCEVLDAIDALQNRAEWLEAALAAETAARREAEREREQAEADLAAARRALERIDGSQPPWKAAQIARAALALLRGEPPPPSEPRE